MIPSPNTDKYHGYIHVPECFTIETLDWAISQFVYILLLNMYFFLFLLFFLYHPIVGKLFDRT